MAFTSNDSTRALVGVKAMKIAVLLVYTNFMMMIPSSTALSLSASPSPSPPGSSPALPGFVCPPGFFSFGTSLSDTGSLPFSLPGQSPQQFLPYGETFFGRNAWRCSDGRLIVDFLSLAFEYPLLSSYFQSVGPNFLRGVNFAAYGATAIAEENKYPFFLDLQVAQFLSFKRSTFVANKLTELSFLNQNLLPSEYTFEKGLYILLGFGKNDFTAAYVQNVNPATASSVLVPRVVNSIVRGIQALYSSGARSFLVVNERANGCSPSILTTKASDNKNDYDELGCLISYNQADQALNNATLSAVETLRKTLIGSSILYFDFYAASLTVLQNPQIFGFSPENRLVACCGTGGQYNYNVNVTCSQSGLIDNINVTAGSCSNPREYISWDGVHFTDAFNGVLSQFLLTGQFLDPPLDLQTTCNLDFSQFHNSSFATAYPNGVLITAYGPKIDVLPVNQAQFVLSSDS